MSVWLPALAGHATRPVRAPHPRLQTARGDDVVRDRESDRPVPAATRHQEFLRFLKDATRAYPECELHLVMDNYAAQKRVEIRDWLAANRRVQVHFTQPRGHG